MNFAALFGLLTWRDLNPNRDWIRVRVRQGLSRAFLSLGLELPRVVLAVSSILAVLLERESIRLAPGVGVWAKASSRSSLRERLLGLPGAVSKAGNAPRFFGRDWTTA